MWVKPRVRVHIQKSGNTPEENEDEYDFKPDEEAGRITSYRCAIADGATETVFARLWARILVSRYCNRQLRHAGEILKSKSLSDAWKEEIEIKRGEKPFPWYVEEKINLGAFSSFLGLTLTEQRRFLIVWIGDSCIFQVRDNQIIESHPFDSADKFNNRPALISTHADRNKDLKVSYICGRWQDKDRFLLMTDAAAHAFLSIESFGNQIISEPHSLLETVVSDLRLDGKFRNDDTTIVDISVYDEEIDR